MVTIALRLDPETRRKLELLAKATGYRRSQIVGEAVRRFVDAEYAALLALQEQGGAQQQDDRALTELSARWKVIV